ncbi:hypothetical protein F5Y09DRAFT_339729 [Xylaria sp. FL1042]|nr:hypothetical protein F5Y09DRAFT_339729 [Xylaria sp. FL1042]
MSFLIQVSEIRTKLSFEFADNDKNYDNKITNIIESYEAADEDEKQEWDSLHALYREDLVDCYKRGSRKKRPGGSFYSEEQQEKNLGVLQVADTNAFGTRSVRSTPPAILQRLSQVIAIRIFVMNVSQELTVGLVERHVKLQRGKRYSSHTYDTTVVERSESTMHERGGVSFVTVPSVAAERMYIQLRLYGYGIWQMFMRTRRPLIFVGDIDAMAERLKLRTDLLREIIELQRDEAEDNYTMPQHFILDIYKDKGHEDDDGDDRAPRFLIKKTKGKN